VASRAVGKLVNACLMFRPTFRIQTRRVFASRRTYVVKGEKPATNTESTSQTSTQNPSSNRVSFFFRFFSFYRSPFALKCIATPVSSCSPNTVLAGLNYLKGQPPVLALPDEEYPSWLWTILKPRVLPDDGPGGLAEKIKKRRENRQRIKDQNFMKTQ
jgi:large subunit ribosomal protein L54